jgi:hypothetical protein
LHIRSLTHKEERRKHLNTRKSWLIIYIFM